MGAGGGAVLGKLVDFYGPAMTKAILKATVQVQGIPTMKKIEAAYAGFPAEIREQLKQDLVRTIGMNQDEGIVQLPPLERPDARAAIQDSSLLNLEKAKAISGINKDGSIDSGVYKRVMLDGYEARKPNPSQNAFEQRR